VNSVYQDLKTIATTSGHSVSTSFPLPWKKLTDGLWSLICNFFLLFMRITMSWLVLSHKRKR
jgi:hypothetical protein